MVESDTKYRSFLIRVALERGRRYYTAVNNHWRIFDTFCKAISFICVFLSAILINSNASPAVSVAILAFSMLILFCDLFVQPTAKIAKWNKHIYDYCKLQDMLPAFDDDAGMDTLAKIEMAKNELDADENTIPCLSVAKQNEVLRIYGFGNCQNKLTFIQRTLGQFIPFINYN